MIEKLKEQCNMKESENGAVMLSSTNSAVLNFFSLAGAMRSRSEDDIINLFEKAYLEDSDLAMKCLFYLRDVRGGQGERRLFRVVTRWLANHNEGKYRVSVRQNLVNFSEYGRFDDLVELLDTKIYPEVSKYLLSQLIRDVEATENVSLLGKWMPSINASSSRSKMLARNFIRYVIHIDSKDENILNEDYMSLSKKKRNLEEQSYRKILTYLRKKIDIVETKVTNKDYSSIDYSKLPSLALSKYSRTFQRNDIVGYTDYLVKVKNGEEKINTSVLNPVDIVSKISSRFRNKDEYLIQAWNNLPDYYEGKNRNEICVVDVSGSMMGKPMEVAVSLGIYIAEKNKTALGNHFITFSEEPRIIDLNGCSDIYEKVNITEDSDWGYNTDLMKVYTLILDTYKSNDISKEDQIERIYIVSDMEFDDACHLGSGKETFFKTMKKMFNDAGYDLPSIVFWNVDARNNTIAVGKNEENVSLVSGYSPSILKQAFSNKTPYEFMLDVLMSERYINIK